MPSALVLTGVTQRADLEKAPLDLLPHWVLENLGDLLGDPVELLLIRTE
jgi:ribonucleotide monophosphatase NagD (HAD superfamily)